MSVRATPLMCLRTGLVSVPNRGSCANWATASTAQRTSRSARARSPAAAVSAARAAAVASTAAATSPANGTTVVGRPRRCRRPSAVEAPHDVPEALRGRGDGGALRARRRARRRAVRVAASSAARRSCSARSIRSCPSAGLGRHAVGRHRARRGGEPGELPAGQRRRGGGLLTPVGGAGELDAGLVGGGAPGRGVGGVGRAQQGLGGRAARRGRARRRGPARRGRPARPSPSCAERSAPTSAAA